MNPEVKAMIENTYSLFLKKFGSHSVAWNRFLEFVAVDNSVSLLPQMQHRFEWLFDDHEFARQMLKTYDYQLLKSDFYDHLGDMYVEKAGASATAQGNHRHLKPTGKLEAAVSSSIPYSRDVVSVLQPSVISGRSFMAAQKQAPNAVFFGIADDIGKARLTLTNMLIHNLRGFVLHADKDKHALDPSTEDGRYNWGFANKWHSHFDKLRSAKGLERKLGSDWSVVLHQPHTLKNDSQTQAPALE